MTNFSRVFNGCKNAVYKGVNLYSYDYFPVEKGEKIRIVLESTSSEWQQGVLLEMWGRLEVGGKVGGREKNEAQIWEHLHEKETIVQLFPGKRPKNKNPRFLPHDNTLLFYNMWLEPQRVSYKKAGAAMKMEEVNETTKRYHCNDGHDDEDFDDLVFTIERLGVEGSAKKV